MDLEPFDFHHHLVHRQTRRINCKQLKKNMRTINDPLFTLGSVDLVKKGVWHFCESYRVDISGSLQGGTKLTTWEEKDGIRHSMHPPKVYLVKSKWHVCV